MARSNIYHVVYHLKNPQGKRELGPFTEFVSASAATSDAIAPVITSNNHATLGTGWTVEIERIATATTPNFIS